MKNPNGPYPGRQLFLGLTVDGNPALAYLVTGRSPKSRERTGIAINDEIRMGPLGDQLYDPLRHYTAVKYDNTNGMAIVSNGIQTEAIFETYRLLYNVETPPGESYIKMIMDGADAEPDSLKTPRISGVITKNNAETEPIFILSIKTNNTPAMGYRVKPEHGKMTGISTYKGDLENPEAFDQNSDLAILELNEKTPKGIAEYLYNISEASHQGDDIRVCAIGGVCQKDNIWNLEILNRHET
ncbi:IMP cyclohydrolase [Chloroflexota bacterium]